MKKLTTLIKVLSLFCLLFTANGLKSQTLCTASFVYTTNPGGSVTFSATSPGTGSTTSHYWSCNSPGVLANFTVGANPTFTFQTNGVFTVSMTMVIPSPSCTSTAVQVVTITNVPCNLVANFNFNQNTGNSNVFFNNTTTGASPGASYLWNFGDNTTSTLMNPSAHTYSTYGSYLVTLTVNNNYTNTCASTKTMLVNYNTCTGGVAFSYSNTGNGNVSLFASSPQASTTSVFTWYFPSNNNTYSVVGTGSTSATFSANGTYFTQLLMTSPNCSAATQGTVVITNTIGICNLNADFVFNQNSGSPNTFFMNSTTGASPGASYLWNFGDNTTSTLQSPTHNYANYGQYLVTLTVNNNFANTCISTKTLLVNYNTCVGGVAFTYSNVSNGVVFLFPSSPQASTNSVYNWRFYNGTTNSVAVTAGSAIATYSANGSYNLQLIMTSPSCSASTQGTVVVSNATGCNLNANFLYINGNFINTSSGTNANTTYLWNFGDNTTGTGFSPAHTYSASGVYTVTMVANNNTTPTCVSTKIGTISINITCQANANFSISPTGVPQVWTVLVPAQGSVTAALWNWGDGTTTNTLFTTHNYASAGNYSICLSLTLACGSSASFCNTYAIFKGSGNQNDQIIQLIVVDPSNPTAIKNITQEVSSLDLTMFQNPNNGLIQYKINGAMEDVKILVADITGKTIFQQIVSQSNEQNQKINLSDAPAGLYLIRAECEGKSITKKLIIEK
jgi:PKD repeat protein